MATTDEIARRVQEADTARSAQRAAAAQRIGELAQRRGMLAEQLDEIERALGDELAAAQDVMAVDELAAFTDVPAADLTRWLSARTARKPVRTRRKRAVEAPDGQRSTRSRPSGTGASTASEVPEVPVHAAPRSDGRTLAADAPA